MGLIEDFIVRYTKEYDFYDQAARIAALRLETSLQEAGIRVNVQVLGLVAAVRDGRSRFGGGRGVAVVAERGFGDDPGL
jgi:hypothetical protein